MMVNQLIMAIARAIRKEFQQEKIFTDSVEQGIETPCFFILCISQKEFAKLDVSEWKALEKLIKNIAK